jgi:uncharacterized OB-fold protein
MSEEMPVLPPPTPTALTAPFWRAGAEGVLRVQQCSDCGALRHPPTGACWRCQSLSSGWKDMPGTGTVYSFVWVDTPVVEAFAVLGLFNVSVVELDGVADGDEPVRLVTRVNGVTKDELAIGLPVTVAFDPVDDEVSLPVFRPQ